MVFLLIRASPSSLALGPPLWYLSLRGPAPLHAHVDPEGLEPQTGLRAPRTSSGTHFLLPLPSDPRTLSSLSSSSKAAWFFRGNVEKVVSPHSHFPGANPSALLFYPSLTILVC